MNDIIYSKMQWLDEVKDQNGNEIQKGTPLSATNMNRMEAGIDLGNGTIGAIAAEVLQRVGTVSKELDKWQNQRLQQGVAYLYNKAVISGCVVSAMPNSRYLQITATGTYTAGNISKAYVDGKIIGIPDQQMVAMIPQNTDQVADAYYAYIDFDPSSGYKVFLGTSVPAGKLVLYTITVPAGDNKMDLSSVTISDSRRIESSNVFRNSEPYVLVNIPGYPMLDADDYDVNLTIQSASDVSAVGDTVVYDKQANGFKIKVTGSADNIQIRWTLMNPNLK